MDVVGYVRLSRDEDKENYTSVINQKKLIQDYANNNGFILREIYVDDNVSGYTFDRPALRQILDGLENGMIDTVIAKDLSRIGRHNAKTLLFLEELKRQGKRLILIEEGNGGFDTSKDDDDIIGIKTWYNERYVKDISRKITSSVRIKQKEGKLITRDYFGYVRDSNDKNSLDVDEETAEIVRLIFRLYIDGNGYKKVAEFLNEKGYPTPSQVQKKRSEIKGKTYCNSVKDIWTGVNVQRIIKDDIYIGTMRFGKTRKQSIKGRSVRVPVSEQFIFKNFHQPIISIEDFELAQRISVNRNNSNFRGGKKGKNLFSGFLYCSDCDSYMVRANSTNKPRAYICGKYHNHNSKTCGRHHIREDKLIFLIKQHLMMLESKLKDKITQIENGLMKRQSGNKSLKSKLSMMVKEKEKLTNEYRILVAQKIRDLSNNEECREIIENNYKEIESEKLQSIKFLERQISETETLLKELKEQVEGYQNSSSMFNTIINCEELKRSDLELLIDKIIIDKLGNPSIYLRSDIDNICNSNVNTKLISFVNEST